MALKREFLAALGVEESKIQSIIDAHIETVDALKKERDAYKAEADKLPGVQAELEKAQAAAKNGGDYAKLKDEFDKYKADTAKKEILAAKKAAVEKLARARDGASLSELGVSRAVKFTDYDALELDENGEIKNAKNFIKQLQEDWKDNVEHEETRGANTATPPVSTGAGRMTADQIMAIKDTAERQKAIAQNLDLFGGM